MTLPDEADSGKPRTVSLIVSTTDAEALRRNDFNRRVWATALKAAKVDAGRENGMHALRHFFASVLLDAGESIKAVSEYLGHTDAGFTLRTYTHLMPTSDARTRSAIDGALACYTDVTSGSA